MRNALRSAIAGICLLALSACSSSPPATSGATPTRSPAQVPTSSVPATIVQGTNQPTVTPVIPTATPGAVSPTVTPGAVEPTPGAGPADAETLVRNHWVLAGANTNAADKLIAAHDGDIQKALEFLDKLNGVDSSSQLESANDLHTILENRNLNAIKSRIELINNTSFRTVAIVPDLGEPALSGAVISGTPADPAQISLRKGSTLDELKAANGATKLDGTVSVLIPEGVMRGSTRDNNTLQLDGVPILTWDADATITFVYSDRFWKDPITESAKELQRQQAEGRP